MARGAKRGTALKAINARDTKFIRFEALNIKVWETHEKIAKITKNREKSQSSGKKIQSNGEKPFLNVKI